MSENPEEESGWIRFKGLDVPETNDPDPGAPEPMYNLYADEPIELTKREA